MDLRKRNHALMDVYITKPVQEIRIKRDNQKGWCGMIIIKCIKNFIHHMIIAFINRYMSRHNNCIRYSTRYQNKVIRVFTEEWYDKNVKGE